MMTLVTGGSKCGKSRFAESCFEDFEGKKFYIATMLPFGGEAHAAIARHRNIRRGKGFETVEKYVDIEELSLPDKCGVLLECAGNLCANEMFRGDKIIDPTDKIVRGFIYLKNLAERLVIVTNNVDCDGNSYEKGTAGYIRALGGINRKAAEISDNVVECVYGIPIALKGALK